MSFRIRTTNEVSWVKLTMKLLNDVVRFAWQPDYHKFKLCMRIFVVIIKYVSSH